MVREDGKSSCNSLQDIIRNMTVGDSQCTIRNKKGEPLCYIEKAAARKMGFLNHENRKPLQ